VITSRPPATRADVASLRALVRLVERELADRLDRGQLDGHRLIASDARHLQAAAGSLRARLDEALDAAGAAEESTLG
jgi:hypothetical protein